MIHRDTTRCSTPMKKGSSYKRYAKVAAIETSAPEFESKFRQRLKKDGAPSFATVLKYSAAYTAKIMTEFDGGHDDDGNDLVGQFVEENTYAARAS